MAKALKFRAWNLVFRVQAYWKVDKKFGPHLNLHHNMDLIFIFFIGITGCEDSLEFG